MMESISDIPLAVALNPTLSNTTRPARANSFTLSLLNTSSRQEENAILHNPVVKSTRQNQSQIPILQTVIVKEAC